MQERFDDQQRTRKMSIRNKTLEVVQALYIDVGK